MAPLTRHLLISCTVRAGCFVAEAGDLVFLVGFEIAFEPFDMAIAFESEDMRCQTVKEEAVMADDHGATGEAFERFLER